MNIDQFPPEILMKIFSYLPSYENVALVNSKFYSVVCCIHKPIICLDDSDFDSKENTKLQSIMNTTRKSTKISINFKSENMRFELVIALIKKFSASIVCLKLKGYLEVSDFLEILPLVPNVVHLILHCIHCFKCHRNDLSLKKPDLLPKSDELDLHHLKTLEVYCCSQGCNNDIMLQFNRLPAGVLETLTFNHRDIDELNDLFKMQTKMKNLNVNWGLDLPTLNNADLLDGLRLESLKWIAGSFNNKIFPKMLSKQTNLKSLFLIHGDVGGDVMNVITKHLTKLQCLRINLGAIPFYVFNKIEKLKMLKYLSFEICNVSDVKHLETFAAIDNSRITTLDIECVSMSKDLIASLARSVPKLKILRFHCDYSIETLHAVMKNFNFIEVLEMNSFDDNIDASKMEILSDGFCANKQLKELSIHGKVPYNTALLENLIKHYPNLNKLGIHLSTDFTAEQFEMMLIGFEKLELLILVSFYRRTVQLKVDDLYLLKEHRNNLKFIALKYLDIEFTKELGKNLKEIFDFVSYSNRCLKMAVSRKTMENECFLNYF